jgi:hypothetical protein
VGFKRTISALDRGKIDHDLDRPATVIVVADINNPKNKTVKQRFLQLFSFNSLHTEQGAKIVEACHQFLRRDFIGHKEQVIRICLKLQ